MSGGWQRYTDEQHGGGLKAPRWVRVLVGTLGIVVALAGALVQFYCPGPGAAALGVVVFFAGFAAFSISWP